MIHAEIPFRHYLLQIAVAERIAQVPSDVQNDDSVFEMPSTEQRRSSAWHQFTLAKANEPDCDRSEQSAEGKCRECRPTLVGRSYRRVRPSVSASTQASWVAITSSFGGRLSLADLSSAG